jgi:(1->4)-alpha-D-glucan 1-alpha-D-glucosylmutase
MLCDIKRAAAIDRLALAKRLYAHPGDGGIKMYLTSEALGLRRRNEMLFREGAYAALDASGPRGAKVVAFARGSSNYHVIVAAGRFFAEFDRLPQSCVGETVWQDTFLSVPGEMLHARYVDLFTGHEVVADRDRDRRQVCMADIFAYLPVAMLVPLT